MFQNPQVREKTDAQEPIHKCTRRFTDAQEPIHKCVGRFTNAQEPIHKCTESGSQINARQSCVCGIKTFANLILFICESYIFLLKSLHLFVDLNIFILEFDIFLLISLHLFVDQNLFIWNTATILTP